MCVTEEGDEMAFVGETITITIGSGEGSYTVKGWGGGSEIKSSWEDRLILRKVVKCPKLAKSALSIKGKTFPEYIQYRLVKDNIGFVPSDRFEDGSTDCRSYIKAVAPANPVDFLVYAHELGHCKSRQYEENTMAGYSMKASKICIRNELNAWLWALRYYRRLGFSLCAEGKKKIKKAFSSYLNLADKNVALLAATEINQAYDIGIDLKAYQPTAPKQIVQAKTCLSWKPWHELKQKQLKKSWKHQK